MESVEKRNKKSVSYDLNNCQIRKVGNDILSSNENQFTAKQNELHMKYTTFGSKKLSNKMGNLKRNLYSCKSIERQLKDITGQQTTLMQNETNQELSLQANMKREYQMAQNKIQEKIDHKRNESQACQQSRKQSIDNFLLEEKEKETQERIDEIEVQKNSRDLGQNKQIIRAFKNVAQNQIGGRSNIQLTSKMLYLTLRNLDIFTYLVLLLISITYMAYNNFQRGK